MNHTIPQYSSSPKAWNVQIECLEEFFPFIYHASKRTLPFMTSHYIITLRIEGAIKLQVMQAIQKPHKPPNLFLCGGMPPNLHRTY